MNASDINVDTDHITKTVTLEGRVPTADQKALAEDIAKTKATGYSVNNMLTGAIVPQRSFVWEASDPYLYVRTTCDGRIMCGGEDEPFSDAPARDALLLQITRTLERRLHTFSAMASQMICTEMLGFIDPDRDLFAF